MSKSVLLRGLLLRAWRERWNECQWGLNIKKILPRGVSGDAYNLADCILQQAVVGSGTNQLILSYLRHSLCSHLISYAAVLKWISNYDSLDQHKHCILALMEFLDSIIAGVTCGNRQEEMLMLDAMNQLIVWLWKVYAKCSIAQAESLDETIIERMASVLEKICTNDFLLGIICLAKIDNPSLLLEVRQAKQFSRNAPGGNSPITNVQIEESFERIVTLSVDSLKMIGIEAQPQCEAITYALQPLLVVELQQNPSTDMRIIVELLMLQKLKKYSRPRLYAEIIRACLMSMLSVNASGGTSRESLWCAFTFIKVPQILKLLTQQVGVGNSANNNANSMETDCNDDILEAFDQLLLETALLDQMDFKCSLNTVECLLTEFAKHNLVSEKHVKHYAAKREGVTASLQQLNTHSAPATSSVKYVIRAEQPLSGILKTLNTDYNKVQEALLSLLVQVLLGNSFELILSVATVEGKLKTFVQGLIKCNECSKQIPGEVGKTAATRAALFDVTFLILTFIVQTYGSEAVLDPNSAGDSFFETWIRNSMVERKKWKSPMNMVQMCDQNKVDDLLMYMNTSNANVPVTASQTTTTLKWHEVCENIPAMLYHVLLAWENGLSATDVKVILDNLKTRMCSYSVCAASWLCAYMHTVNEDEHAKPLNMVQQLLTATTAAAATPNATTEENGQPENFKERLSLTFQIIRKMQQDYQSGNMGANMRLATASNQYLVSQQPLEQQFVEIWTAINDRGYLPVEAAQILDNLLASCGSFWLIQRLVREIYNCKYIKETNKTMDLVFAIMHLNIEDLTIALLAELLPILLQNPTDLIQPHSTALARLCVYAILSAIEISNTDMVAKKRGRSVADSKDIGDLSGPNAKLRKLDADLGGFVNDLNVTDMSCVEMADDTENQTPFKIREPLLSTVKHLFKTFAQFVVNDEYSPKVHFAFEFMVILVNSDHDAAAPILKLVPSGFIPNLLKVMPLNMISPGLVLRLYDLTMASSRQNALSDLCLLRRNRQVNFESIKL